MSQPFDLAVTLQTIPKILQQLYFPKWLEQTTLSGDATNAMFSLAGDPVLGDGKTYKFKRSPADTFRPSTDALGDLGTPDSFGADEIKVRWNERDSTAHDFIRLAGTSRVSVYQLMKSEDSPGQSGSGDAAIVDIVKTMSEDFDGDFKFKYAVLRNMDRTARLFTVTADTPVNDDHQYYAKSSAYTAGATSVRVKIANGPIGWAREGLFVDVYTSAGALIADNLKFTSPVSTDGSVGLAITTRTTTVVNLDSIASTHEIFWSGSRNQGMWGPEAWLSMPETTDVFMGGVNRSQARFRALIPLIRREGEASSKIAKSMFDDAADALANKFDKPENAYMVRAWQAGITALRAQYDEAAFITWPSTADQGKRYANLGSSGLNYRHPALGLLMFKADSFMRPGFCDMLNIDDWMSLYYKQKDLFIFPGSGGYGYWDRMESAVPGQGKTPFYQMQAFANVADFCKAPQRQVRIKNLQAT